MKTMIRNVLVYDGLGSAPFISNVCISNDKIIRISKEIDSEYNIIVDGKGLAICPGFIDIHSHSDLEIFRENKQNYAIRQGITTQIIGQDGISIFPTNTLINEFLYDKIMMFSGFIEDRKILNDFVQFRQFIDNSKKDTKIESLVGHGTIRMIVGGQDKRLLSQLELTEMKHIIKKCLIEGALGVSFSLNNSPSSFADEDEIVEICKIVAEYDKIAMIHFGDDNNLLLESIDMLARIGRKSLAKVHMSQLKAVGSRNHGKMMLVLEKIDRYVKEGIKISFDCYPYLAINAPISILLKNNAININEVFEQEELYINAIKEIDKNIECYGGDENIILTSYFMDKTMEGKRLGEIRKFKGISSSEIILNILKNDKKALALFFSINKNDLELLLKHPLTCICTDGIISNFLHPRVYGTFPRVLGNYVRMLNLLSMEDAISKMTSEPAKRLNLWDRGIIREGMAADLVLFDPNKIKDGNSYLNPKVYPVGIKAVWVNGIMKYGYL